LDPARKLIFFGSEGCWAPTDDKLADILVDWVNKENLLPTPCSLFIRPHFSDVKSGRFERFRGIKNVYVDNHYTLSNIFIDNCDPPVSEVKMLTNAVYHSEVMVAVISTLVLDACCLGKPTIAPAFNAIFDKQTGKDISRVLYETDHYGYILDLNAVDLVKNEEEFFSSLKHCLVDKSYKRQEREELLQKLCYQVDGFSSERIVNELNSLL